MNKSFKLVIKIVIESDKKYEQVGQTCHQVGQKL